MPARKIVAKARFDFLGQHVLLRVIGRLDGVEHLEIDAGVDSGSLDQRLHIFGKTRTAVTGPGIKEVITNTRIAANTLAHGLDVGTEFFSQIGQLVHEADTRGQHGVGGIFGQLGAANIHHDQAVMIALERGIDSTHIQRCLLVRAADDDTVGLHEVINRRAFLEELGIGNNTERRIHTARPELFGHRRLHRVGRADRDRTLIHDDLVVGHVLADVTCCGSHVLHVGGAVFIGRRTHSDELNGAKMHSLLNVSSEMQASGSDVTTHHFLQAGLVNRNTPVFKNLDLGWIDIQTQHIVANFSQTGA